MIGATTSALLGDPIWAYLVWGLPTAIALASIWTRFTMARTIAEIALQPGQAAIRSVYDVLREHPLDWESISTVRSTSWNTELSVGRTTFVLYPKQWPKYDQLQEVARQSFQPEASSPSYA